MKVSSSLTSHTHNIQSKVNEMSVKNPTSQRRIKNFFNNRFVISFYAVRDSKTEKTFTSIFILFSLSLFPLCSHPPHTKRWKQIFNKLIFYHSRGKSFAFLPENLWDEILNCLMFNFSLQFFSSLRRVFWVFFFSTLEKCKVFLFIIFMSRVKKFKNLSQKSSRFSLLFLFLAQFTQQNEHRIEITSLNYHGVKNKQLRMRSNRKWIEDLCLMRDEKNMKSVCYLLIGFFFILLSNVCRIDFTSIFYVNDKS